MRRLLLLLTMVLGMSALHAQQVANGDFEIWNSTLFWEYPDTFYTSAPQAFIAGATPNVYKSSSAHSGNYAVNMKTVISPNGDTIAGMLSLGTPESGGFSGGLPYTDKPDSVIFWAKHQIAAGDTALVMFAFQRQGVLGGFMVMNLYGSVSNYIRYSAPVSWFMPSIYTPDTVILIFSTSGFDGPLSASSEVWIDDIGFNGTYAPLPNNSFEDWTQIISTEPQGWNTFNAYSLLNGNLSVTQSTDSYHGNYAARIETVNFFGDMSGVITNGDLGDELPSGGMAVNANPLSLHGYYKYIPVGPDTALAALFSYVYDPSGDSLKLIEEIILLLPPASIYTPFTVPLTYNGWPRIDSLTIAFASGNFISGTYYGLGSALYIDSLTLEYNPIGISESGLMSGVKVYPLPANDVLNIQTDAGGSLQFELYNISGQKVLAERAVLTPGSIAQVDVSKLAAGDYLFRIHAGKEIKGGKVKILH